MPTPLRSIVIVLPLLLAACESPSASRPGDAGGEAASMGQRALSADEQRAVEIARAAVAANDDWVDRATFDPKRDGDGWRVLVQRHPIVPGGHRTVRINADGEVAGYHRGR